MRSTPSARSVEVSLAGSAQLDSLYVPTEEPAVGLTFDGFPTELWLEVAGGPRITPRAVEPPSLSLAAVLAKVWR